ncbi:MAG: phospholipase D-like domain-containing protein DpdK [Burkholderiaceae bacterium]|nr:phospholipase D-like domain-containing protein DpdK [Burkholderiaceae bacterium]
MSSTRQIFKSATTAPTAALDALAMVLAQELQVPSEIVYLMTPWISNIVVFDNRMGQFEGLNPEWTRREIRLVDVLVAIASNNTRLVVRVRPLEHNHPFRSKLLAALDEAGLRDRCDWTESSVLHTKSLLTNHVLISGSMNFTESGIRFNDESLTLSFDAGQIAQARMEFATHGTP